MLRFVCLFLCSLCFISAAQAKDITLILNDGKGVSRQLIVYLFQSGDFDKGVDLYQQYKAQIGKHDHDLLSQIGEVLLERGATSNDPEQLLISLYGAALSGVSTSIELLSKGISSQHLAPQLAAINILGRLQDDRCDELLKRSMNSPYLEARMEAGYQLSIRKHRTSTGHMESLMHRLPPQLRVYFPEFFAIIGTTEATTILKNLMHDPVMDVRLESMLVAMRHGRDDLLPEIRRHLSGVQALEQEVAAIACGMLGDTKPKERLLHLAENGSSSTQLAAQYSLQKLGEERFKQVIIDRAKREELLAIPMLGQIEGTEKELIHLLESSDASVKFNAGVALLEKRHPACIAPLLPILIPGRTDLGLLPYFSSGRSMMAFKVVNSAHNYAEHLHFDIPALTSQMRHTILNKMIELPEIAFLELSTILMESGQLDLIPTTVRLLENIHSPKSIELLKKYAEKIGAPHVRGFCNLALYRMKEEGPYKERVMQFVKENKETTLIQFRPLDVRNPFLPMMQFELTPEVKSRLLIESFEALSAAGDESGYDLLLDLIKNGNEKNRCAASAMLIKGLQ